MNERELISFRVTDEDIAFQQQDMLPYWEKRSIRHKILSHMTPEWKAAYRAGIFTEFMEQRGPGHTVGSENIYRKGFLEYKEDIGRELERLDYLNDPEALDKEAELKGMYFPTPPYGPEMCIRDRARPVGKAQPGIIDIGIFTENIRQGKRFPV